MYLLRHLLSIAILPATVVLIVPRWLLRTYPSTDRPLLLTALGVVLLSLGLALFGWCVWLFAREGKGTLAPWDPTKRLVVRGPYRHVRNPMITGVATMLLGEALCFASIPIVLWFATFVALNHTYFLLIEEPGLERRFAGEYAAYKSAVPRWIPRRRPWSG